MLKIIKAISLATIISIGLVGCAAEDLKQEPTNLEEPEVAEKEEVVKPEQTSMVYENEECGFVMSFPDDWYGIEEAVRESEESTAIYFDLNSTKYPELKMTILAVRGDHSRNATPIGTTDKCVLYVDEAENDPAIKQITDTFAVVNGDLAEYYNEKADFGFKYPKEKHIEVVSWVEKDPSIGISLSTEESSSGYLMEDLIIVAYIENYNQWMEENAGGPYVQFGNGCEDEVMGIREVYQCEDLGMGKTSYFASTFYGDTGIKKYYHFERTGVEYPSLVMRVQMYTEDTGVQDFEDFKADLDANTLSSQKLERLELADSVLETLEFEF